MRFRLHADIRNAIRRETNDPSCSDFAYTKYPQNCFYRGIGAGILSPRKGAPIHSGRSIAGGMITTPFISREQFLHFQSWGKITIYRVIEQIPGS